MLHVEKHKDEIAAQQDENGLTVLSLATLQGIVGTQSIIVMHSLSGDLKMVEFLVENFPSLGEISDTGGTLPIHFAAAGGKFRFDRNW